MKRLFILLVLNMYLGISVFAQEQKTTQELLTSTKWEPQDFFANGNYGYVKYTKTEFFTKMKIDGELRIFNYRYYLSSSPDTVFDSNKIGKNNNGKYIIRKSGKYVIISEILELTATKLVLKKLDSWFYYYREKNYIFKDRYGLLVTSFSQDRDC